MALEGHGIAFLPHSAVKKDLRTRKLVRAAPSGFSGLEITMDIRACREKPSTKDREQSKNPAHALWDFLQAHKV